MMRRQAGLFARGQADWTIRHAIAQTVDTLAMYGSDHDHWVMAYSGGKDSTTFVTATLALVGSGKVPAPKRITVLRADTRQELPPLWIASDQLLEEMEDYAAEHLPGVDFRQRTVAAPIEHRFLPYMLGRGVPPPNNGNFRWCTPKLKIEPMARAIEETKGEGGWPLILIGVREGESAARDQRIAMACSADGTECGSGHYYEHADKRGIPKLAPIIAWRDCHVVSWLLEWAPADEWGEWSTEAVAEAYGGHRARGSVQWEQAGRTGCICCPLVQEDRALLRLAHHPTSDRWHYLRPLLRLHPLYRRLREDTSIRLRKPPGERRKDGTLSKNQGRKGPLTMEGRRMALDTVLEIQREVNDYARANGRPCIDILNDEEEAYIRQCWQDNLWPQKWDGTEPLASDPYHEVTATEDGRLLRQELLRGLA